MDLDQQPRNSRSAVGRSGSRGRGRTSAGMEKNLTRTTANWANATVTPMQASSLSSDTKMKILAAEMELLNDFVFKKHGVLVLNVSSVYFKALHASTPEMDQIKRSLDGSLADTPQIETRSNHDNGGDDLDETLIVVKEEPNWSEEDTLVVDPEEQNSDDSDERADLEEGNVATGSEGRELDVEQRMDASFPEPSLPDNNGGAKKHKCRSCSKVFGFKSQKEIHERTHTGEMPFKCRFCPKTFTQSSNKTVHERIHKGDKPFSCHFRPKTFSDKSNKLDHDRTHRDDRPFSCELCDASFRRLAHKTGHMRTHTREKPFQCEDCEARFGSKQDKVKHMRTHTGEKPFQCEYCDKWFSQGSSLSRHLRVHTNEKPYACSICGKNFADASNLRAHTKIHRK